MYGLVYVTLLIVAIYFFKIAIIDRKAEIFSFVFAFILFALLSITSMNIEIAVGNEVVGLVNEELLYFNMLMGAISLIMALLSALDMLPEGSTDEF